MNMIKTAIEVLDLENSFPFKPVNKNVELM